MSDNDLLNLCQTVAENMLQNNGWTLAYEWIGGRQHISAAFLEEVHQYAVSKWKAGATPKSNYVPIRNGVLNQYSRLLYLACMSPSSVQVEIAYTELWKHLYDVALYKLEGDRLAAEECAQTALVQLFEQFEKHPRGFMRDEGAFLAYARSTLRIIWSHWREPKKQGEDVKLVSIYSRDGESEEPLPIPNGRQRVDKAITQQATRQEVEDAIRDCLRSKQQQRVIIALFLDGLAVWEVTSELDKAPQDIYVLKSRAISRLKKCPGLFEVLLAAFRDSEEGEG